MKLPVIAGEDPDNIAGGIVAADVQHGIVRPEVEDQVPGQEDVKTGVDLKSYRCRRVVARIVRDFLIPFFFIIISGHKFVLGKFDFRQLPLG